MGCASSSVGAIDVTDDGNNNAANKNGQIANGDTKKATNQDNKTIVQESDRSSKPPQAVSFNVGLGETGGIDSIISKHPPKRLKRLEPIANAPVLTPEMLEEKLRKAEEKRHKEIEKKVQVSRRSSRLRKGILQARELDKVHNQAQEASLENKIEDKHRAAELAKEAKRRENEEKKRKREERARIARERAQKIKKEAEEGVDYELEKDEAFNADEDNSWLDGDKDRLPKTTNQADSAVSLEERIYSGRESPHKPQVERRVPMSAASTTDSFDYAFHHQEKVRDDFFDS